MKKLLKRVALLLSVILVVLAVSEPFETYAKLPYLTYTQNGYGQYVETQAAYTPYTTLTRIQSDIESVEDLILSSPSDIKITDDGYMYIADTKNSRIIVATLDGKLDRIIGEDILAKPTGVFVTEDEETGYTYVYVADNEIESKEIEPNREERKKNGAVYVFKYKKDEKPVVTAIENVATETGVTWMTYEVDYKYDLDTYYTNPESPLYGSEGYRFVPMKVAVDQGGIMYIICKSNTNGIVQISPEEGGTFLGYFGTNEITVSLSYIIQEFFLTSKQAETSIRGGVDTPTNVDIDDDGLIYTVTQSTGTQQTIKKLNKSGANMLKTEVNPKNAVGITAGQYDNVYAVSSTGYIYEYTGEGSLLFRFGGKDEQAFRVGLFASISAIDVDKNDRLYVVDDVNNEIQIFQPTEFTDLVHESLVLYQNGRYTESKKPLEEIILMNSLFDYANEAMGHALFQEENFKDALYYYRLAKDYDGYSDSFWEIRNVWLTENLIYAVILIILLWILLKALGKLDKLVGIYNPIRKATAKIREKSLYKQIMFAKQYIRHPIDGAYSIKHEGMKSYPAIIFFMVLFMVIMIVNKYFSGFLVKTVRDGSYYIPTDILTVVLGFLFAAAITYLICTITDGEARFKDILMGYLYSFTPYFILQPIIYVVGMVVTQNEYFIIEFANVIMFVWIAILLFMSIKELNNYSTKETFKVIGITLFAAIVFVALAFIMYVLAVQVINFVLSIYGEVVYRLGK